MTETERPRPRYICAFANCDIQKRSAEMINIRIPWLYESSHFCGVDHAIAYLEQKRKII